MNRCGGTAPKPLCVQGDKVRAGVQVCLATSWALCMSVCNSLPAYIAESFCPYWGMLHVCPLQGGHSLLS